MGRLLRSSGREGGARRCRVIGWLFAAAAISSGIALIAGCGCDCTDTGEKYCRTTDLAEACALGRFACPKAMPSCSGSPPDDGSAPAFFDVDATSVLRVELAPFLRVLPTRPLLRVKVGSTTGAPVPELHVSVDGAPIACGSPRPPPPGSFADDDACFAPTVDELCRVPIFFAREIEISFDADAPASLRVALGLEEAVCTGPVVVCAC